MDVEELREEIETGDKFQLVDIRSVRAYAAGHIDGSRCIPAGQQIELRLGEIATDTRVVLISSGDDRLAETRQTLIDLGTDESRLFVVEGGIEAWEEAGLPLSTREAMSC